MALTITLPPAINSATKSFHVSVVNDDGLIADAKVTLSVKGQAASFKLNQVGPKSEHGKRIPGYVESWVTVSDWTPAHSVGDELVVTVAGTESSKCTVIP